MNPWQRTWRDIRLIVAEWLLLKAAQIMPPGSFERVELALFLKSYMERRVKK